MRRKVIDNRYEILKKLGSGAMGDVYKVRDLKNNAIIALKILSKEKTTSKLVQRFKREFRLLTELHHPNLCSVYDFGTLKDGRSYFTMEYIDGPNILEFTKNLPYEKIYPVKKNISNGVYPLIVQLCRVLEYIHSKGLIHYDIKPGNVLIARGIEQRADGRKQGAKSKKPYTRSPTPCVKLMDFGLAGEQRIKSGATIRGTYPYIAPEVIKGFAVDHRVDLYSLGVVLYEIFTRRALHVKKKMTFVTLLKQQGKLFSASPSKIVADMPKQLERLIVRLLSFEPAARFSRANEIIKGISKLSRLKFALETAETIKGYLLSSRFVGRDKEMDKLKSLFEEARQDDGKVVLITGDAGIGKSRLLREFKTFTQMKLSHTFIGYAHKDKTEPLKPFYDIFKELINHIRDESGRSRSRATKLSLAVLFRIFPDLRNGHLRKNLPKIVPLEPKQEKLRNFEALSELIGYCASNLGELVILLEDLHWADNLTIEFLEYLGRNLVGRNILICGTSRKQKIEENLLFKKVIDNLKKENYFTHIDLKPLKFRNLYSFLDSTITPGSNSSGLARYLMKKTGGNPFFVEEIMRTFLRKKGVSIGEKIEIEGLRQISIPGTIENVVLKRIKDLDSASQKVVEFGAVLLKDFDYDFIKWLTGLEYVELSRALWELKRRQILIEEGNTYRFYHSALREAINKRMAYRERRKLYYQSGNTLEFINKRNTEKVVEDLAYYFINAKDRKKGVRYGLRAARRSSERYANEQAIGFYKGVLDLLGKKQPRRRFDILSRVAKIEFINGYYNDAIEHYNKTLRLETRTIDKKIEVNIYIAIVCERKGEYNKAVYIYQRVIKLLKKMKFSKLKTLLEADIYLKICRAYQMMGEYKNVSKFNFNTLKLPKKGLKGEKALGLYGTIYHNMGVIETIKSDCGEGAYDKAVSYYKRAYQYYKKIRDDNRIAAVLNDLGVNYDMVSNPQAAFGCWQKAIQISVKTGNQSGISIALGNLGQFLENKGCYSKALACLRKAFSISSKIEGHLMTGNLLHIIGMCFFKLCDYKEAKKCYERSLKILDTGGWKGYKVFPIRSIGKVYLRKGDYILALRFYKEALEISEDIGYQVAIADSLNDIGLYFIEIGEFLEAKRYVEDALKIATTIKLTKVKIECYIHLCRISIMMKNYAVAKNYYERGIRMAKTLGMRRQVLRFLLLVSEIYFHEGKYLQGIKPPNKTIKIAREMGTKDLHAEALLIKVKHEIKLGTLSKIEILGILNEAKRIAEEIGCPEILWKVYFEYGKLLQEDKQYPKALEYYQKCHRIFMNIGSNIESETYKMSYLSRSDRQAVYTAKKEIKNLFR